MCTGRYEETPREQTRFFFFQKAPRVLEYALKSHLWRNSDETQPHRVTKHVTRHPRDDNFTTASSVQTFRHLENKRNKAASPWQTVKRAGCPSPLPTLTRQMRRLLAKWQLSSVRLRKPWLPSQPEPPATTTTPADERKVTKNGCCHSASFNAYVSFFSSSPKDKSHPPYTQK